MPRMRRLEFPGTLAHIMARGIDGTAIFSSDHDKTFFIVLLTDGLKKTGMRCLAWCLMENHYHLLVRSNEHPLSNLMRPLNGSYAKYFNARNKRRGYLFQDRFKSVLCQDQEYARQLIRYIHLNPLRAGMVQTIEDLSGWQWCGHGYMTGSAKSIGKNFHDRREALRRFGNSERSAIKNYTQFLSEGFQSGNISNAGLLSAVENAEISGSEKGWPAVIGNPDFAKKALEMSEIRAVRLHRKSDYCVVLEKTAVDIGNKLGVKKEILFQRGRKNLTAHYRAAFCYAVCKEELLPQSQAARYLNISLTAVSKLVARGKARLDRGGIS